MMELIHHYLNDILFQEFLMINILIYHYKKNFVQINIDKKDQLLLNVLHLIYDKFQLNKYLEIMYEIVHIHYEYLLIHDNVHQNLVMLNDQIEFEIFLNLNQRFLIFVELFHNYHEVQLLFDELLTNITKYFNRKNKNE